MIFARKSHTLMLGAALIGIAVVVADEGGELSSLAQRAEERALADEGTSEIIAPAPASEQPIVVQEEPVWDEEPMSTDPMIDESIDEGLDEGFDNGGFDPATEAFDPSPEEDEPQPDPSTT